MYCLNYTNHTINCLKSLRFCSILVVLNYKNVAVAPSRFPNFSYYHQHFNFVICNIQVNTRCNVFFLIVNSYHVIILKCLITVSLNGLKLMLCDIFFYFSYATLGFKFQFYFSGSCLVLYINTVAGVTIRGQVPTVYVLSYEDKIRLVFLPQQVLSSTS